ncbi:MAG: hypothetical protein ABEK84_08945 [Salinibacter sp.]
MEDVPLDAFFSLGGTGGGALLLLGAAVVGGGVYAGVLWVLRAVPRGTEWTFPLRGALLRRIRGPLRLLVPLLCVYAALPAVHDSLPELALPFLTGGLYALFIGAVGHPGAPPSR